jgi:fatty acid desaturase
MPVLSRSQQLARTLAQMSAISPTQGLSHALIHTLTLAGLAGAVFVFWEHDYRLALVAMIPFSFVYTAVLVTGHDCIHRTYTGIKRFDDWWGRFWSWNVYGPFVTYTEIHKLHHGMLGRDFEDPERPTYRKSEYDKAGVFGRWYIRHQWLINIFVFGGFGMIARHIIVARRLRSKYPQLNTAMRTDFWGITLTFGAQIIICIYFDVVGEFLASYLIVERVSGGLIQLRAMAEHYGLWEGRNADMVCRQAMSCRNIRAGWFTRWLFNDLCFHSIHHVYPSIPWYKLGEAQLTIPGFWDNVNQKAIEPKMTYLKVFGDGVRSWRLINEP